MAKKAYKPTKILKKIRTIVKTVSVEICPTCKQELIIEDNESSIFTCCLCKSVRCYNNNEDISCSNNIHMYTQDNFSSYIRDLINKHTSIITNTRLHSYVEISNIKYSIMDDIDKIYDDFEITICEKCLNKKTKTLANKFKKDSEELDKVVSNYIKTITKNVEDFNTSFLNELDTKK